ncbi:hypothetical protein KL953_26775 [Mycolicibacterium goodii]|uniref:hypothetical protein n=1 Tax=Mycolicibacterium goodii TaxID=134601 RepID=UPI001BDD070F|nr:hypothetical protein [Mycolicibacterium goodii]MBU8812498.1 hypothetical protein [Mycolicibacterium goodii]ULN44903.1 hypothetical protein MI170_16000 [Mycolicibacterium goodii]
MCLLRRPGDDVGERGDRPTLSATPTFDPNARTALISNEEAAHKRIECLVDRLWRGQGQRGLAEDRLATLPQANFADLSVAPSIVAVTMDEQGGLACATPVGFGWCRTRCK